MYNNIKTLKKQSLKSERKKAKSLGVTCVPGSGCSKRKGDHYNDHFLIEQKDTTRNSFSIKKETYLKIYKEASDLGKSPVLNIDFKDPTGDVELYAITREDFIYLMECKKRDLG